MVNGKKPNKRVKVNNLRASVNLVGYVAKLDRRIDGSSRSVLTVGVPFSAKINTDGSWDRGSKTGYFDVTVWEDNQAAGQQQSLGQLLDYVEIGMDVAVGAAIQDMRYYENGKQTSKRTSYTAYSINGLGFRQRRDEDGADSSERPVRREAERGTSQSSQEDEGWQEVPSEAESSDQLYLGSEDQSVF